MGLTLLAGLSLPLFGASIAVAPSAMAQPECRGNPSSGPAACRPVEFFISGPNAISIEANEQGNYNLEYVYRNASGDQRIGYGQLALAAGYHGETSPLTEQEVRDGYRLVDVDIWPELN
ncbi:hypothetical protein [Pseudonocardia sp. NPDC049635]|uniref:hypothetical protein n=1 Tax=Pseudonocardia sp. NPDC049635 TaxID=3155506 RepID=UPI0033F3ACBF